MSDKYTIVVKLGSSSIVDPNTQHPRISNMSRLVTTLSTLRSQGHKVVLVSSGAIAMGMNATKITKKPKQLATKQALAALGQNKLISLWDGLFHYLDQSTAQILLTRNDIVDYNQFKNAENTLEELLKMEIIPIVNENDTISTQEIKFGDNDTLSAITAGMVSADYLFLLTDVDCLYTDNPRTNPDAKKVLIVKNMNNLNVNTKSGAGSSVGTGGMETKLIAADLATNAGVTTVICNSNHPEYILDIVNYSHLKDANIRYSDDGNIIETEEDFDKVNIEEELNLKNQGIPLHTRFIGQPKLHVKNRQFWLLHGLKPRGSIIVDYGCFQAITRRNRAGLLPVGVIGVEGDFGQLECVEIKLGIKDSNKSVIVGRGRCNCSSTEVEKVKGLQSEQVFGLVDSEYVVHRDNLAFPVKWGTEVVEFIEENFAKSQREVS
ncbi:glutamate 5-kinase [Martiniozyma asiatica (nom. inval.)]|nr:glutamate 5-kinase [Martiniozyma asiatica]